MDNEQSVQPIQTNPESFGMTEKDYKNSRISGILQSIKIFFLKIEPTIVKILNISIYYLLKFIKGFVKTSFDMIRGKE